MITHAIAQIEILERMRGEHLERCRFCQRKEDCDVIRGFDCAIAMHRRAVDAVRQQVDTVREQEKQP